MANVYNKPIVVLGGGAEKTVDNGAIYEGKYRIRYFDIDGTILKIEYVAEGGTLTPPNNPNYDSDYLIFYEWNYDVENYIVDRPLDVGALYNTKDTEGMYLFCRLTAYTGLTLDLKITNFTVIDWGDGTVNANTSHTYEKEGYYVIKINATTYLKASVSGTSLRIMGNDSKNESLEKVYLGKYGLVSAYSYYYCKQLKIISFFTVQLLYADIIGYTYSLRHINIKEASGNQSLGTNYLLTISGKCGGAISTAYPVRNSLLIKEFVIDTSNTTISANYLAGCSSLTDVFILHKNVPTLSNVSAFPSRCIFWVNDNIIEDLKVATNWSTYASQMKPRSWYPSLTDPNA